MLVCRALSAVRIGYQRALGRRRRQDVPDDGEDSAAIWSLTLS